MTSRNRTRDSVALPRVHFWSRASIRRDLFFYLTERHWRHTVKALFGIGLVILVLGIFSFLIPVPRTEHHGVSAGDLHVGVNTHHSDRVPPAISVVLVVAGAGMMIAGRGKGA